MSEYQLYVLSPQHTQDNSISLFNQVYSEWKNSFSQLLSASGATLDPDDFYRSHFVLAVLQQDQVVALDTMTVFDTRLDCTSDHHYWQALQKTTLETLKREGVRRTFSLEYLNVLPKWRKNSSRIRWSEVLIGLGLKLMDDSEADGLIGTPRIDVKVLDVCLHLNSRELQEPIKKMNYPCSVVFFPKTTQRKFADPITQIYVDQLYNNRIDTLGSTFSKTKNNDKRVA
jgi:hypothetical protein